MTPKQARALRAAADELTKRTRDMVRQMWDESERCVRPKPGAIVRHFNTGRLFRVVNQSGELKLDTLGDGGFVRGKIGWWEYDVEQDGNTFQTPEELAALEAST